MDQNETAPPLREQYVSALMSIQEVAARAILALTPRNGTNQIEYRNAISYVTCAIQLANGLGGALFQLALEGLEAVERVEPDPEDTSWVDDILQQLKQSTDERRDIR